jgi:hypothetical protein
MTDVMRILIALLIWLGGFSAIYGLHGLGCSLEWTEIELWGGFSLFRMAMVVAWIGLVVVQIVVLLGLRSTVFGSASPFVQWVSISLGITAVVAAIWSLFPLAILTACI